MFFIEAVDRTTREVNQLIRHAIEQGQHDIHVYDPRGRHSLGVALFQPVHLIFAGSVGFYCGAMGDGPTVEIHGSAGWSTGEGLQSGSVIVRGNAGNATGAAIHGGSVCVHGSAAARTGIAMNGGMVVIGSNVGYMSGFMMHQGDLIVCGNASERLGHGMDGGRIFVAGAVKQLGEGVVESELTGDERAHVEGIVATAGLSHARPFRKFCAGGVESALRIGA
jgi:glutamate synthase domain-containing protein 3